MDWRNVSEVEYNRRIEERQELYQRMGDGNDEFVKRFFSTDMNAAELIGRYSAGERDFSDVGLVKLDLSGINLAEAKLTGAKLVDANLSSANLAGSDLSYAWLGGANLSGANLTDANLFMTNALGANFENANLRGANNTPYDDGAYFCNTIMPDGTILVGPFWAEE